MMVGTFLVAQQLRLYTSTARGVGGFPGSLVGKESTCKGRRPQFNSWVGKICWRRERLPTLVFWLGEFHGLYMKESYMAQNSLELNSSLGPPHHSMQNKVLSHWKKKMDIKVDCAQLPASPTLWPISRIPCPSHLRDNPNNLRE